MTTAQTSLSRSTRDRGPLSPVRRIASAWHGGQSSPLYAIASTGTVPVCGWGAEIRQNMSYPTTPPLERFRLGRLYRACERATADARVTLWVCTDCYFAHHYGYHEHDGSWFSGESDTPADRQPLGELNCDADLSDWTDAETGEGLEEFSWSSCDGCGSTLGGARYRLALHLPGHIA